MRRDWLRAPGPMRSLLLMVMAAGALGACPASRVEIDPGTPANGGGGGAAPGTTPGAAPSAVPGLALPDAGAGVSPPMPGTCAEQVHTADKAPVDLLLLVDTSDSMDELSGTLSKWELTRQALRSFIADPASAGLGMGLMFFPSVGPGVQTACRQDSDCAGVAPGVARACRQRGFCFAPGLPVLTNRACAPGLVTLFNCPAGMQCLPQGRCPQSGGDCVPGSPCAGAGESCEVIAGACFAGDRTCEASGYQRPDVEIGELPAQAGVLTAALAARAPEGSTPTAAAAQAALGLLGARARTQPGRRLALVLATDGLPSACGAAQGQPPVDAVVAQLERGRAAMPAVPTYVVGVFAADEVGQARPALDRFAAAGGTRAPFVLTTGDDLSQRLLEALQEIRGLAVACEYAIPQPAAGPIDFSRVNVRTSGGGATEDLGQVAAADRCSPDRGGWYYDPPPAAGAPPSRLVICPASCARLRADPTAQVDLLFGCATRTID